MFVLIRHCCISSLCSASLIPFHVQVDRCTNQFKTHVLTSARRNKCVKESSTTSTTPRHTSHRIAHNTSTFFQVAHLFPCNVSHPLHNFPPHARTNNYGTSETAGKPAEKKHKNPAMTDCNTSVFLLQPLIYFLRRDAIC